MVSEPPGMVRVVRYVVVFDQPPGGHPYRENVILEAESDEEVMRAVVARWSREEVLAVRWDNDCGHIRRVWVRL